MSIKSVRSDRGLIVARYAVILLSEVLLALLLRRLPGGLRANPGLGYVFLIVVVVVAATCPLTHTLFAVLAAIIVREIWLRPLQSPAVNSVGQDLHLIIFAGTAGVIALVQNSVAETRRKLVIERVISGAVARKLQGALAPLLTSVPGYAVAFRYEAATQDADVGGDFVDVFHSNHRRVALVVGDVTGHGIGAAIEATQMRAMLAACGRQGMTPADCLSVLNDVVESDTRFADLGTVFYGAIDTDDNILTFATAGHEPPMLLRASSGQVERLRTPGTMLGVVSSEHAGYGEAHLTMGPGDVLLMYTDGLVEARRHAEFFGEDRLQQVLSASAGASPDDLLREIYKSVHEFAGGTLRDDAAALVLKRQPGPASSDMKEPPHPSGVE